MSYPGGLDASAAFEHRLHTQSSMMTLSLAGNLLIGDAIVWWRACVIWQHKVVNCIGLLLSASVGTEGAVGGTTVGNPASEDPLETSMNKETKAVGSFA
ncbi:hypothetical protein GSI_04498 [Ganoderma sinense ZZ0214-1]|uniref:Uncharacterized protein n=1 Tax=Ganoderma sinense ZZ0214-1 TaxID=1077348 RepID=A0A2G8SGZ1_9APHY|nr:hypothetical protein GSI_04498 [Ganoderma sinense ZZ0214-1]